MQRWANAVAAKLVASRVFVHDERFDGGDDRAKVIRLEARAFRGHVAIEFGRKPTVRAWIEMSGFRAASGRLRSEKRTIEISEVAGRGFNTRIAADVRLMDWRIAASVLGSCHTMADAIDHALRATRGALRATR
jgi:hypothetical protein